MKLLIQKLACRVSSRCIGNCAISKHICVDHYILLLKHLSKYVFIIHGFKHLSNSPDQRQHVPFKSSSTSFRFFGGNHPIKKNYIHSWWSYFSSFFLQPTNVSNLHWDWSTGFDIWTKPKQTNKQTPQQSNTLSLICMSDCVCLHACMYANDFCDSGW